MIPPQKINNYEVRNVKGIENLFKDGKMVFMSVPDYNIEQIKPLMALSGHVLLSGLGLGWLAEHVASKQDVKSVTVVEVAQEIIDMVWPCIDLQGKGSVVCVDIWNYETRDFDSACIDISTDFDKKRMREKLSHIPKVILLGE